MKRCKLPSANLARRIDLRSALVTCSLLGLSLLASCSGDDDADSGTSTGGSTPSTGGTASDTGGSSTGGNATGGTSVTGGTAAGGTSAGGPGKGGSATTGGRATTGGAGGRGGSTGGDTSKGGSSTGGGPEGGDTGETPFGAPDNCMGDGCPFGECGGPFNDDCDEVYPGALDSSSMYCASGSDDGYCLTAVSDHVDEWAISCDGGSPTFELCSGGCAVSGGDAGCT
jgi:hypothetical protein